MKMIAVWGSSGAGKSTVALSLATKLAEQKENVVVVNLDTKTPSLPLFLPRQALSTNNSIGELIGSDNITYDGLRSKIHIHPDSDRIGFAGLVSGENPVSTKVFEREKILDFLRVLDSSPFSYIIFDCDANTLFDQMTLLALEISDHIFRVLSPDVKGYEFEKSALMWLRNSENFMPERHRKVANMVHDTTALEQFKSVSGNIKYVLPFGMDVYNKFSAGQLIKNCGDKKSIQYEKAIEQMVKEVLVSE